MITVEINYDKFMTMMATALRKMGPFKYDGTISDEYDIYSAEYSASDEVGTMARTIVLRCMEYVEDQDA